MIKFYINSTDRTADIERTSISKTNEIQQRSDSLSFMVFQGLKPSENQDIQAFVCDEVASIASNVITLAGKFDKISNKFRAGQKLFVNIGQADQEKVVVQSYNPTTLELTLVTAPIGTVTQGDLIGEIFFGGVVSRVADRNVGHISNLEYDIECVSYVKIFDRKLVADSWADVDARYIINSFVNSTINYNSTLDSLSYANNGAIQAEWIESGIGNNPTIDSANYLEGNSSGVFSWTGIGTAIFSASPLSVDLTDLTGVASGAPTKGFMMLWGLPSDFTLIDEIRLRIGSDSSNYLEVPLSKVTKDEWNYLSGNLVNGVLTGTPNWAAADYIAIVIDTLGSGDIALNGFRMNAQNSFTLRNVEETLEFSDFRAPQIKPTSLMQTLAKSVEFIWYIDYERDINFKSAGIIPAPINLTDTSNNFTNLGIEVDQSQLGNRIIIRGGERTSTGQYSEVRQGNNAQREWLMKSKFNNLEVVLDDNSSTDLTESGTNTTNITIAGHGLATGDFIINRTRDNAVREIVVLNANNFTVEAVAGQTTGDTLSFFSVPATIGIEGIADESTVDYVYNSNEKSVRATPNTVTLSETTFIKFTYNERLQVSIQYTDPTSANLLKGMGIGDGIFDLDPITDRNITDTGTALTLAKAKINDYRNPIIRGKFGTDQDGLRAGQTINIADSVRGINSNYVIQSITTRIEAGEFGDYFSHDVKFGTTLFGIIEFYQKLLKTNNSIEIGSEDLVETYIAGSEDVFMSAVELAVLGGGKQADEDESVLTDDTNNLYIITGGWQYEPSTGQPIPTRYGLSAYS
jgi:hypothetical protein